MIKITDIPIKDIEIFLKLNDINPCHSDDLRSYKKATDLINSSEFESTKEIDYWLIAYDYTDIKDIKTIRFTISNEFFNLIPIFF